MPSSRTLEDMPELKAKLEKAGVMYFPVASRVLTFPDGGTVFVSKFWEYEGKPYLSSTDGDIWRMLPSDETGFGYTLESCSEPQITLHIADMMHSGIEITEQEAIALLKNLGDSF